MAIQNSSKKTCAEKTILQTKRLHLRAARESDLNDLHEFFSDEKAMEYWSGPPHTGLAKTKNYLDFMIKSPTNGVLDFVLVLQSTGKVIGKAGVWETENNEMGFMLNHLYWGKGYMAEALQAVLPHVWDQGVEKIIADVDPRNDASIGLLEKFGFAVYARKEKTIETHIGWCDSVFLSASTPRPVVKEIANEA